MVQVELARGLHGLPNRSSERKIMKMRSVLATAAILGFVAYAGAASALTISAYAANPSNTVLADGVANGGTLFNGQIMIDNFGDNGGPQTPLAGFSFSPQTFAQGGGLGGYIRQGSPGLLSGESAAPPLFDGSYESGYYFTVTADGGPHLATLSALGGRWLTDFSFYLGSPDTYNTVQFFVGASQLGDTLSGRNIWACPGCADSGDQTFGARANYNFGGAHVTSVVFGSSGNSFEFDNLAGTIGGIPEPASWALMILGFGGVGAALRSRRKAIFA